VTIETLSAGAAAYQILAGVSEVSVLPVDRKYTPLSPMRYRAFARVDSRYPSLEEARRAVSLRLAQEDRLAQTLRAYPRSIHTPIAFNADGDDDQRPLTIAPGLVFYASMEDYGEEHDGFLLSPEMNARLQKEMQAGIDAQRDDEAMILELNGDEGFGPGFYFCTEWHPDHWAIVLCFKEHFSADEIEYARSKISPTIAATTYALNPLAAL